MNGLERSVRRLLRQVRDGSECSSPLGDWLRQAYRTHRVDDALDLALSEALRECTAKRRVVLTRALRGGDGVHSSDRSYYRAKKEVVERLAGVICDRLKEMKSRRQKGVGEAMPIALPMVDRLVPESIRPEQYRGPDRGRALSAAALSAEMCGEQQRADALISEAADNVRDQFDRRDVAAAFEVSQNEFFIARCRGDLQGMRAAIRNAARLYNRLSPGAHVKFALDCSEVYLYEGRLPDACSELNFALLNAPSGENTLLRSIALVRKSQIALARHDLAAAEGAATMAMQIARSHADIRVYAAEVLGRSSLQTGSAWSSDGLEECESAFHALSVRAILARHHLRRGDFEAACKTAYTTYERAMKLRYWNIASRSAATLALCVSSSEKHAWLAQALRLYLTSKRQNAYVGDDLFEVAPRGPLMLRSFLRSDDAVALMGEVYLKRFPDSLFEPGADSLLSRLARVILQGTLDPQSASSPDLFSSAKKWSRQSSGVHELDREVLRLGRVLRALSIFFPSEQRENFIAANRRQTYRVLHAVRRSLARYNWTLLRRSE